MNLNKSKKPLGLLRRRHNESRGERLLLPEEIPRFIGAVNSLENVTTRDYFLMLLFTGQRNRDVAGMTWEQIDLDRKNWRIPRTKNGTAEVLPLVEAAVTIVETRFHMSGRHPVYVFPKDDGSGPLWNRASAWRIVLKHAGITNLRMHDLRINRARGDGAAGVAFDAEAEHTAGRC